MWKLKLLLSLFLVTFLGCSGGEDPEKPINEADVIADSVTPVDGEDLSDPDTGDDPDAGDVTEPDVPQPPDICEPLCDENVCGDDGCGGNCGECEEGFSCEEGACLADCVPNCVDKECGFNGCGGNCGSCPNDAPLCHEGVCEPTCIPDCVDKDCGFDGCLGSCGGCPGDNPYCEEGICVPDPVCGLEGCVLTGNVYAPEGSISINQALVYATINPPPPMNTALYCDKCFSLSAETPQTVSGADGSFELLVPKSGAWNIVVQKGSFRRVRPIEVTGGIQPVDPALTSLPPATDPENGDSIPKMAVVTGGFDSIDQTIEQLGIEAYDTYDSGSAGVGLLFDPELLAQYQIVYIPCAGSWFDSSLSNPELLQNIRNFVASGGKLYVTDWSYDLINVVFPGPIVWLDDTGALGSAQSGVYDAEAIVQDEGLKDWLAIQGVEDFYLDANWTIIDYVQPYTAPNELNFTKEFEPTVWVEGIHPSEGVRPCTVSFQYGCGRVLFSTYHSETFGGGLLPQELALLYTILEVNLCIGVP